MAGIRDIWLYANNILRSARQMVNDELKPLNLSSAEGNILLHLLTQEGAFQQEDLVEQLDISKPAISRALDSLEEKGFISRMRDPADKRANQILLTGKAQEIGPKIEQVYSEIFAVAVRVVSEEDIREFIEVFGRVSHRFSVARANKRHAAQKDAQGESMAELKTQKNEASVEEFLNRIPDETRRKDCLALAELMRQVTGFEPMMWGSSMIGFGDYHYQYATGREGDTFRAGFSPRKQNLTIYLTYGFEKNTDLMEKLGKHKIGKACLYIKRLADVDIETLRELIRRSMMQAPTD